MDSLRERLLPLITPIVVERFGLDFIDLELKGGRSNKVVRIIVDADGGVKLDTCAALSQAISDELDAGDLVPGRYRLEVSSPGVDRPLRTLRDFQRNLGRTVRLHRRGLEAPRELEGVIETVTAESLVLTTASGRRAMPWPEIEYGKLKIQW
ncbi:MAG: ribosome maturation factor RimP [candidate division KSB1 bacterium]|nr:ribosome maturation factor RimP [candidate division KSB1 bacterium]MDZ7275485.1 ribosome maturation factor RimP [candidate division KSB1 bacterium]MDZ7286203.1 ribosome maturation factor RimP [candidate division KSB1 bacterium]MDZ7296429.1 ribosome maturation factor RimP [candidate division KSB1 bacterium]MDZ7309274.1 ribosome maturation factor RimP [candidate division KSB1 bacterium]